MKKNEKVEKGRAIKLELYSRPNATNGKYSACGLFYLVNLHKVKDTDIFYLESLQVRADSADKIISEAEEKGLNNDDKNVMKELGEKINALGDLVHKNQAIMTAVFVTLRLTVYYSIAVSIWSLVFNKSFFSFLIYGLIAGFIISLLFVAPIISTQRTRERIKDIVFSVGSSIGAIGVVIGVVGLVVWIIKLIFF